MIDIQEGRSSQDRESPLSRRQSFPGRKLHPPAAPQRTWLQRCLSCPTPHRGQPSRTCSWHSPQHSPWCVSPLAIRAGCGNSHTPILGQKGAYEEHDDDVCQEPERALHDVYIPSQFAALLRCIAAACSACSLAALHCIAPSHISLRRRRTSCSSPLGCCRASMVSR